MTAPIIIPVSTDVAVLLRDVEAFLVVDPAHGAGAVRWLTEAAAALQRELDELDGFAHGVCGLCGDGRGECRCGAAPAPAVCTACLKPSISVVDGLCHDCAVAGGTPGMAHGSRGVRG